jgi:hypothetical protein
MVGELARPRATIPLYLSSTLLRMLTGSSLDAARAYALDLAPATGRCRHPIIDSATSIYK